MHFWAMVEQSDSVLQGEWMKWSNILGPKDDNTLQGTIPHPDPVIHQAGTHVFSQDRGNLSRPLSVKPLPTKSLETC